jgi:hypothetical protein
MYPLVWGKKKVLIYIYLIKNEKKSLHCEYIEANFEGQTHWDHAYITNLSCNELIMKIV